MKLKYHDNLDGVRAIAVLMVMIFHFFPAENNGVIMSILKKFANLGQTGVTLFFVLSGFLITRILINTKEKSKYFTNFYMRRFLRIFPLYYVFLILTFFVFDPIIEGKIPYFIDQVYYYTYLQNFAMTFGWTTIGPSHFWSLAVEEHFYLFWPLLVYLLNIKKLRTVIFGIIFFSIVLRIIFLLNNLNVFYFTFTRIDSLSMGALLAVLEYKAYIKKQNANKFLIIIGFTIIPNLIFLFFYSNKDSIIEQTLKFSFISLLYFGVIGYVISIGDRKFINKFLKLPFLSFTGRISYGLYVFHPISYMLFLYLFKTRFVLINIFAGFVLSYVFSIFSYYLIERSFLKLKRFF